MTKEFKVGDEPVPGYRLGKFLGRGGFGEVWRAVGPGGTEVALKSIALDRKQGMKEFRSLRLVKRIHHPNLVPILAFWLIDTDGHPLDDDSIDLLGSNIIDSRSGPNAVAVTATMQFNAARPDQLIIAMGLGEKNLLDVLKEHQAKGLPGIPLEELLDYMEGSARAIDFLNTARHSLGGDQPVAIQHCDIKPQNIMLVGDAVQVCDFGLARSLTDVRSTSVAGSIAYGAPELFWENKPTHATDQYSLAITYYELRTGQLPFGPDMAAIEVMQAHRDGKLDLHHLNDAERSVIKRATTPAPAGRFEKTIDMVRALRRATQDGAQVVSPEGTRPAAAGIRSSIVQTGREIVPGYTLLEHLFHPDMRTDVWSASAPGGKPQAIWLYDLTSYAGSIDRDALRSIQALTDHPRLARINGWWILNKSGLDITTTPASLSTLATSVEEAMPTTLVVASELTRTNLAHRVEECRQFRGKGIPVEELLSYMQQIAEGVDALNDASHSLRGSRWASLVHTDLRPANLLVFGQVVKIGNFAWCRTLEGEEAEASGMPVRASRPTMAPELVAGRINRRTDQYALAASYVQMRTGDMLFESGLPTGAASGALAGGALDFSALSEGEAQVIHRAMHADPQQRYPSCRKMVAELALAIKKAPVGILETVYPMNAGPGVGTGTMVSSGLVDSRHLATVTLPEALNPQDTKPDVYQTIVREAPIAIRKPKWRLSVKLVVSLGVVLLAGLAAALTGKQTDAEVNRFIAANEYKNAIEAIDAPLWRRWRSDPRELRDRVVKSATEEAKRLAEQAEVQKALLIQNELKEADLSGNEQSEFRNSVFQVAIQLAYEKADARDYGGAYETFALLSEIDKKYSDVVDLGRNIWQRWTEHVLQHAEAKNFETAARVFQELSSIDDENVHKVKAAVIAAGIKAITDAQNEKRFGDALDIANRLKEVEAFADDTGLKNAIFEALPRAIAAAQDALKNGNVDEARGLYKLLAALQPHDTQVIELNKSILDYELQKARGRLEEHKWEAALTEYDRVLNELSKDERDASTAELDELKGKILTAAKGEFDEKMKSDADEDLDRAGEICDRLGKSLPDNLTVEIMVEEHKRRSSKTTNTPTLTPEMIVERLLGRTDENVRDRVLDEAEKTLAEADAMIAADLPGRADLLRRAAIAHAYLAWQQKDWTKSQSWLEKTKDDDLLDEAEAAQRTRHHLLDVLVKSRFDGASLPADVDLDAVSQTVADLRKADPEWADSADRLLATRVKELSRELGRQAANLTASADPAKRSLGTSILERIDRSYLPDPASVEILIAANQTLDLLNDAQSAWPQVEKSLEGWSAGRDRLPGDLQGRLVTAFAHWGRASKEPEALKQAIDEVERLPRATDELRRQFAELLVEELRREASQAKVSWKDLEETCRRAESAATAAAAADLGSFIKACQAECAVEKALAASKQPPEATFRTVEGLLRADVPESDRAYVDYVILHVASAMHRTLAENDAAPLADRLCETLKAPPEILAVAFRRQASAVAIVEEAKKLADNVGEAATSWTPPPLEPDSAGRVYRWIGQSLKIDPKLADFSTNLALATAAASTTPVDEPTLNGLVTTLSADPQCQSAWILLRGAQSAAKDKPAEAVRLYARALTATDGATLVGDAAQTAFEKVLKPGLVLAQKQVPLTSGETESKKAVAALYAAKGRLVRTQYTLSETGKPDHEAFAAFDQAVHYDPDHADYYVQRGFARWSMSGGSPDLATLEKQDIDPLFDGKRGSPPPGAYGLRGQAKILAARQASGSERLDLYHKSIADFEEAIRGSQQRAGEHFSEFLDGLGTANVEIANYTDEGRDAQRAYLTRAVELADQSKSIEFRPHPEHAWINLGNAEEDFGWVLRDTDGSHYCTAIDAFERGAAEANATLSSPALSMLSQGRCRYKLLAAGGSCGDPWQDELKAALANLDEAINAGASDPSKALPDRLRGQACYWQAQLHTLAVAKDPAKKKERYQQADAALQQAIAISGKQGVAEYYLSSIALAMNLQDYDKAIDRAKKFVDADLPAVTADSKVIAIEYLADVYKRRNDTKSAVETFSQYLDSPQFQEPNRARFDLVYDRAFFIASVAGRFWSDNKKLCDDSARDAVELAQQLQDRAREAKAWRVRAENAKLSYTLGTPSVGERKTYAEYLRSAILCLPGKDDLKDTWGWRVDLAFADYEIANASVKVSAAPSADNATKASALADVAFFSDEAVKTLQGVDAFAKDKPQLIASLGQVRKLMGELFQKHKQYLPANRTKSAQR